MTSHKTLRLSAVLLLVGFLGSVVAGLLHPSHGDPNNHATAFADYANSANWTAVHLGQFVGLAVLVAGLLVLFIALNLQSGPSGWAGRFGAVSAVVTLALSGVLQAVDGVALKQAVDSWASAPVTEKSARFASAEVIRWLEEGVRSYQSYMLGVTLILLAIAIVWTARIPRPIGYLMALSGVAYLIQGWVLGTQGFSSANSTPTLVGYVLVLAWIVWLLIAAWRMKGSTG